MDTHSSPTATQLQHSSHVHNNMHQPTFTTTRRPIRNRSTTGAWMTHSTRTDTATFPHKMTQACMTNQQLATHFMLTLATTTTPPPTGQQPTFQTMTIQQHHVRALTYFLTPDMRGKRYRDFCRIRQTSIYPTPPRRDHATRAISRLPHMRRHAAKRS